MPSAFLEEQARINRTEMIDKFSQNQVKIHLRKAEIRQQALKIHL